MSRFDVIIVPQGSSTVRRFQCSRRALRIGSVITIFSLLAGAVTIGTLAFLYRHEHQVSTATALEVTAFERERVALLAELEELREAVDQYESVPTLLPLRGRITSTFGVLRNNHSRGGRHEGIDIASPRGTSIVAAGNGIVRFTGSQEGYGSVITIDHEHGMTSLYGHCSRIVVEEGQEVVRGQVIGTVGMTGSTTGPHLHYEVHLDGRPVDPALYIVEQS
ncbi:MAG: M23 family metallopeptidase [Deltaproteobacteria bacterium]|nr:M23 family metallopeptidase [Deltaproteobacteria bacterium]